MIRELRGLLAVPLAFFGGLFGTLVVCVSLVLVMWWLEVDAEASTISDPDFLLEFEPGALTKLGVEPTEIPDKPVNEATRTVEDAQVDAVTEDDVPPPEPEPIETQDVEPPKPDNPVNDDQDAEISDENHQDDNPYDTDPPNHLDPTGDPFGDPDGWADLEKDGDPWATSVMKALNNMKVPAWAAKLPAGAPYQFKLKVCKDGTVEKVYAKGSSGSSELDSAIEGEIERLRFAPPPTHIASQMKARCVVLNYEFAWTQGKVR